jgi:hypothetical protein
MGRASECPTPFLTYENPLFYVNEISPRQAAEYHVYRIKLTFITASCGESIPGEIKFRTTRPKYSIVGVNTEIWVVSDFMTPQWF